MRKTNRVRKFGTRVVTDLGSLRVVALCAAAGVVLGALADPVAAQDLVANDDRYGIPFGAALDVEPFGVLENDRLDGESAGENGVIAVLVSNVAFGTLDLAEDGSFTYVPGAGFPGIDSFVYRAEFGSVSAEATVTLSACEGGPDLFTCWHEAAFQAEIAALGHSTIFEGFESGPWEAVRTPNHLPEVVNQGIRWTSNHPDPPAENPISTTSGPPHTGQWAVYDPDHGYATGTISECDVDVPPEHCLYHDGVTGTSEGGLLYGVGGFISGMWYSNVSIVLDDGLPLGGGKIGPAHQFFGVIYTPGFTKFQVRELDGKVGQALYVWADDFTIVTDATSSVPEAETTSFDLSTGPNPTRGHSLVRFQLESPQAVDLSVHSADGRRVTSLFHGVAGAGVHHVTWSGSDDQGRRVPSGVYFVRLVADDAPQSNPASARIVILD